VSLLAYLAVAAGGCLGCLLFRREPRLERAALLVALAGCLVVALGLDPSERLVLGDGQLLASRYLRLWLVAASSASLLLVLLVAERLTRNASLALLGGCAAMALALASPEHGAALLVVSAGAALAVPAAAAGSDRPGQELRLATELLRSLCAAVALALPAVAALARDGLLLTPDVLATATVASSLSVALRVGAVPFHRTSARTSERSPGAVVPLVVAWLPACFVLVAFAWQEAAIRPLEVGLGLVPATVTLLGLATLGVGAVVMLLQEDLAHLVGYSVIADVGFCLLALSAPGPEAWLELRVFLLLFVLAKTAAVAFAFAAGSALRTRRIAELDGWLRRAPLLGVGLVAILLATYGWPGSLAFEARQRLIELALGPGLPSVVGLAAAWLSLAGWLRLLAIGLRRPSPRVLATSGERPRLPARDRRPRTRPELETGDYRGAARELLIDAWLLVARARRQAPLAYSLNRTPLAALLVLVLCLLPLALGAGMGGLAAAAAEPPLQVERSPTGG
jgi:hypothetical protein